MDFFNPLNVLNAQTSVDIKPNTDFNNSVTINNLGSHSGVKDSLTTSYRKPETCSNNIGLFDEDLYGDNLSFSDHITHKTKTISIQKRPLKQDSVTKTPKLDCQEINTSSKSLLSIQSISLSLCKNSGTEKSSKNVISMGNGEDVHEKTMTNLISFIDDGDKDLVKLSKADSTDENTTKPKKYKNNYRINWEETGISATYTTDLNILEIHDAIVKKLSHGCFTDTRILELEEKINHEKEKIKGPQTIVARNDSITTLTYLYEELQSLKSKSSYFNYIKEISPVIELYTKIGPEPEVVSLSTVDKAVSGNTSDEKEYRLALVQQYLSIAKRHVQVNALRILDIEGKCIHCGAAVDDYITDEEDGIKVCPHCNGEIIRLKRSPFHSDSSRVNTSDRNNYSDKDNFYKALMKYQGKSCSKLPDDLQEKLDKYFQLRGQMIGEDIKKLPCNKDGETKGKLKIDNMFNALKEIRGYSKYYGDAMLICHQYWGWKLPDVSYLENTIMENYDRSQMVYLRKKGNRKSSLNTQYRLFRELRHAGHLCYPDKFKMIKTPETLKYHEKMWINVICPELNYKKPKTIGTLLNEQREKEMDK